MQESLTTSTIAYNNSNNSSSSSSFFNNRATIAANDNFNGGSNDTSNDTSIKPSIVPSLKASRTNINNNHGPSSARNRSPISRNPPAPVESTFVLDDDDFAEDLAALREIEEVES